MTSRAPRASWRLLAVAALVLLGGCAYALGPHALLEGAEFGGASIGPLPAGSRPEAIEALLGAPWRRSRVRGRETWEYYSKHRHRHCTAYVLGVLPVTRPPTQTLRARLVFGAEGLEAATLNVTDSGRRETVDLLARGWRGGG